MSSVSYFPLICLPSFIPDCGSISSLLQKLSEWQTELETSSEIIVEMTASVTELVRLCLLNSQLPTEVLSNSFHSQLGSLLNKIVKARAGMWRQTCLNNQVSPAKLLDFDWRVDTKAASDTMNRMSAASLLLSLRIQDTPTSVGIMPAARNVQLELGPQELNTMLDGLTKIKEQLSAIQ